VLSIWSEEVWDRVVEESWQWAEGGSGQRGDTWREGVVVVCIVRIVVHICGGKLST